MSCVEVWVCESHELNCGMPCESFELNLIEESIALKESGVESW